MSQGTPKLSGANPRFTLEEDGCAALRIDTVFADVAIKDYCSEKLMASKFVEAHGTDYNYQEALGVLKESLNTLSTKRKNLNSFLQDAIKYYKKESTVKSFKSVFEYQSNEAKIAQLKSTSSRKGLINALAVTLKAHDEYFEEVSGSAGNSTAEGSVSHPVDASIDISGIPYAHGDHSVSSIEEAQVNEHDADQGDLGSEDEHMEEDELDPDSEDDYSEEDQLRSDLSIDHHPLRKNEYCLLMEANSVNFFDEEDDDSDEEELAWIVNEVNVYQECRDYKEDCFAKSYPEQLDDVGMLALNSVYVFAETPSLSITRHFSNMNCHLAVLRGLDLSESFLLASPLTYGWCSQCAAQGLVSSNDLDLIVANVLHQVLPVMKIVGYTGKRGEDTFVHDMLAPLLNVIFSSDVNLNHCWANVSLTEKWVDYKPDFTVLVNGLSSKFIVLVAEFKTPDAKQRMESDMIKTGKQMKIMLNELLQIGVRDPVVCGICVMKNTLFTFKMSLPAPKIYRMVQLSATQLTQSSDDLVLVPNIVARLAQLKEISLKTASKVQAHSKSVRAGKIVIGPSVPPSWMSQCYISLQRQ